MSKGAGQDLTYFFDQYFKYRGLPKLVVETKKEGDTLTAKYKWEADAKNFRMPVKVMMSPDKFEFIKPTPEWQTVKLKGMDDFKIATNLFLVNLQVTQAEASTAKSK
jgi:aminopeptidase N